MTETKFTKGPWRLDDKFHSHLVVSQQLEIFGVEDYHFIDAGRGHLIEGFGIEKGGFFVDGFMTISDANLIVAAPELYEALSLLLADAADYPAWQRPCLAVDRARAALAKARGETP